MSPTKEKLVRIAAICLALTCMGAAFAAPFSIGAAPKGDASSVASKIIKFNFPACKRVDGAKRRPDGSITATCNGAEFLVFTVFIPKDGRTLQLAMNCSAAKQRLNITC